MRERCGVFRDLDLRFQIRINVYGAVGDDEEPILLGDLENGRLAEQIALFLQALLLVQNGLHEGRGVHQPLHGHIRFAAVNELDGLVCGGAVVLFLNDAEVFGVLSHFIKHADDLLPAADQNGLGNAAVHGHHQRAKSIGVMRRGECHALFSGLLPDKLLHLAKVFQHHSSNTSAFPIRAS